MGKKVLIVEDDPAMLGILADTLTHDGFEVLQARDGQEGLDLALRELPDLILLDLLLPKLAGLDVLNLLRADKQGAQIPVMILSNLNENEAAHESLRLGPASYIIKSNSSLEYIVSEVKKRLLP